MEKSRYEYCQPGVEIGFSFFRFSRVRSNSISCSRRSCSSSTESGVGQRAPAQQEAI